MKAAGSSVDTRPCALFDLILAKQRQSLGTLSELKLQTQKHGRVNLAPKLFSERIVHSARALWCKPCMAQAFAERHRHGSRSISGVANATCSVSCEGDNSSTLQSSRSLTSSQKHSFDKGQEEEETCLRRYFTVIFERRGCRTPDKWRNVGAVKVCL